MSCEACKSALEHEDIKQRAALVIAAVDHPCGCESYSVAPSSPGTVSDDEFLNMIISDPFSLLETGLHPAIFARIDESGMSVLRDTACNEEFELTIKQLMEGARASKNADWYFHGVVRFRADAIRYKEAERLVCIYDTPLDGKPHHADVFSPKKSGSGEKDRRKRELRKRLESCFVPAERFRGGLFSMYARR